MIFLTLLGVLLPIGRELMPLIDNRNDMDEKNALTFSFEQDERKPDSASSLTSNNATPTADAFRIASVTMSPKTPTLHDTVTINATIVNKTANLQAVMLHYQINGNNWTNASMTAVGNGVYTATIPPQPNGSTVNWYVSATTTDNKTVNTAGLKDGGFESGSLAYWEVQSAEILNVIPHSGQYAARIGVASFSTVSTGSVQQAIHIPTDMIKKLSFYINYDINKVVNVTIFYHDGSNSTHSVVAGYSWTQVSIDGNELSLGKTITAIRIEKPIVDYDYLFLDDVILETIGSYVVTNGAPPRISDVKHSPVVPSNGDVVNVTAIITDDYGSIDTVFLFYQVNGTGWTKLLMNGSNSGDYWATIPSQGTNSIVEYYIEANDTDGNVANTLQLVNGDFEDGTIDPWTRYGGSLQNKSFLNEAKFVYNGQYGFKLSELTYNGTFYEAPAWIQQNISIKVEDLSEISFYMKAIDKSYQVTVFYSDTTNSTFLFNPSSTWVKRTIPQADLLGGKMISAVRFETLETTDNPAAIDQIMLGTYTVSDGFTPVVLNVTRDPVNPGTNDVVTINATIFEDNALNSTTLFYRINGSAWLTTPMTFVSGNLYSTQIPSQAMNSVVEYYINATDVDGYWSRTPTYQYVVQDLTAPIITAVEREPKLPKNVDNVSIIVTATDLESGIDLVTVSFQVESGNWQEILATFNGTHYVALIPKQSHAMNVTYFVIVRDLVGNEATSPLYSYVVLDGIPPQIMDITITPPNPSNYDEVTITTNVTDSDSGIANVTLEYATNDTNNWISQLMTYNTTQDLYSAVIPVQPDGTVVYYRIIARDWDGNVNTSTVQNYTVVASIPPTSTTTTTNPPSSTSPTTSTTTSTTTTSTTTSTTTTSTTTTSSSTTPEESSQGSSQATSSTTTSSTTSSSKKQSTSQQVPITSTTTPTGELLMVTGLFVAAISIRRLQKKRSSHEKT